MPSRFSGRHALATLLVVVLAAAATFAVYHETLQHGFDYDDYHFLHPHTREEVLATFHGTWDSRGVMVPFFRPLTIVFHALRFELFGLDSTAHHAMSLCLFAVATTLVFWLLWGFTSRWSVAIVGALLFVTHPTMPVSLVAWVTNQMHLLQILVILSALVWWDRVRARSVRWWLPLLLFAAVSFLIKEDGVMLLPAIVVLHATRRRIAEPNLPPVPRIFVTLALIWVVLLVAIRFAALDGLGGYGRPTLTLGWQRVWHTLKGIFRLVPPDRNWQPVASWFATALPLVALAAWPWISRGARLLLTTGAALAVMFVLPFVFAAKAEQVYMIGLGAVLVLTGAVAALLDLGRRTRSPASAGALVLAVVAAGISAFVVVTRDITCDFEPFGPMVLSHDDIVRTWSSVPPEVHAYLAAKREPDTAHRLSANPLDELAHVSFGFHGLETSPDGVRYLWMAGPRADIHVAVGARTISIPLRHEIGAFREPARASVVVDRRPAGDLRFDDGRWQKFTTVLQPERAVRRMHRIEIRIDHAWRPALLIPGSADPRVLGLQVGEITLR